MKPVGQPVRSLRPALLPILVPQQGGDLRGVARRPWAAPADGRRIEEPVKFLLLKRGFSDGDESGPVGRRREHDHSSIRCESTVVLTLVEVEDLCCPLGSFHRRESPDVAPLVEDQQCGRKHIRKSASDCCVAGSLGDAQLTIGKRFLLWCSQDADRVAKGGGGCCGDCGHGSS